MQEMWLFLAFVAIPLIEIALFVQVGGAIGLLPTLAIVVGTAILGTWLVRSQGRQAMTDLRGSFNELRDPSEPLAHGAMILFSGALLLTPGFFTDAVGFALLVPAIRRAVYRFVAARVEVHRFEAGPQNGPRTGPQGGPRRPRPSAWDDVIEGEYHEVDEHEPHRSPPRRGNSGWTRP